MADLCCLTLNQLAFPLYPPRCRHDLLRPTPSVAEMEKRSSSPKLAPENHQASPLKSVMPGLLPEQGDDPVFRPPAAGSAQVSAWVPATQAASRTQAPITVFLVLTPDQHRQQPDQQHGSHYPFSGIGPTID